MLFSTPVIYLLFYLLSAITLKPLYQTGKSHIYNLLLQNTNVAPRASHSVKSQKNTRRAYRKIT